MKLPAFILLCLIVAAIWLSGLRLIVIQPIGILPDGVTAVVIGMKNANFIDSPDAICYRHEGGVSLLCRGRELAAIGEYGVIILRLPYSSVLFKLTGAPHP